MNFKIFLVSLVLLIACSVSEKNATSSQEKLDKANQYLASERYSKAVQLADEILKTEAGRLALEANLLKAKAFEKQEQYLEAARIYEYLTRQYPLDSRKREWLFKAAACLLKSQQRKFSDITALEKAKVFLEEIKKTYGFNENERELFSSITKALLEYFSYVANFYKSMNKEISEKFYRDLIDKDFKSVSAEEQ
jgi:TolA-binding protein